MYCPRYRAGMRKETRINELERVGLTAAEVARALGVSTRHVWSLHSRGQLPPPRRLGRAVRWLRSELLDYLESGARSRDEWLADKAAR